MPPPTSANNDPRMVLIDALDAMRAQRDALRGLATLIGYLPNVRDRNVLPYDQLGALVSLLADRSAIAIDNLRKEIGS